jgi:predicted metal-dependent phosphoesterase TrpH
MMHYCKRCAERPLAGVIPRVYEYTRSVIVAAYGLAIAAHAMYHDDPDVARAICQMAADQLDTWLYNRLPAVRTQYEVLAHARDAFRQLSLAPDHDGLASLEETLAAYLAEEGDEDEEERV